MLHITILTIVITYLPCNAELEFKIDGRNCKSKVFYHELAKANMRIRDIQLPEENQCYTVIVAMEIILPKNYFPRTEQSIVWAAWDVNEDCLRRKSGISRGSMNKTYKVDFDLDGITEIIKREIPIYTTIRLYRQESCEAKLIKDEISQTIRGWESIPLNIQGKSPAYSKSFPLRQLSECVFLK